MNLTRRSFIGMLALLPFVAKAAKNAVVSEPQSKVMLLPKDFVLHSKRWLEADGSLTRGVIQPLTPEDICKMSEPPQLIAHWRQKPLRSVASPEFRKGIEKIFADMTEDQREAWFKKSF